MKNLEIEKAKIRAIFDHIVEPELRWAINDLNLLKGVEIEGKDVCLTIRLIGRDLRRIAEFRKETVDAVRRLGYERVVLDLRRVNVASEGLQGVKHIVLVAAGKGGVGKSMVAVNLAAALLRNGQRVGLMDADIYGPSIPVLLGTHERPEVLPGEHLMPVEAHGLKTMSIGYLLDEIKAVDWRGNVASGTVLQFLHKTFWGELDYLVVDMPPGTGDIQLTLAHRVKASGVVLVSLPQEVVLGDVRRAAALLKTREIPLLGIVENMSHFNCESCGHHNYPFPQSAHPVLKSPLKNVETLATVPLSRTISDSCDKGVPLGADASEGVLFTELAQKIQNKIESSQEVENRDALISTP